jgi:hypothetical protein
MPRTQLEGDIPLTGLSTGAVDAMECVLLKMGVDQSEFTTNTGAGRINMFQGNGASASAATTTPAETALMGTAGTYNNYDQVILPCWGVDPTTNNSVNAKSAAEQGNLVTYGNNGGHFFATHYSYAWLYNNYPYNQTAQWDVNANTSIATTNGVVSNAVPTTNPGVFLQWLNAVGALTAGTYTANPLAGDVTIANARHDVDQVAGTSSAWITGTDTAPKNGSPNEMLLHYTFDTPVTETLTGGTIGDGGVMQCGHAIFSDFHVANSATGPSQTCTANSGCSSNSCAGTGTCQHNYQCTSNNCNGQGQCVGTCNTATFPSEANLSTYCGETPMTAQEKILEYMIWDLASCVPPPPTSTCSKKTCSAYPSNPCGQQSDGCGGLTIDCNPCGAGQVCGGGGVAGVCGSPVCTPKTCTELNANCGQVADGCGGLTADCGTCTNGQTCGGGGTANQCGTPQCTPETCQQVGANCGPVADGCGGIIQCGTCVAPDTCGGGGTPSQCGSGGIR